MKNNSIDVYGVLPANDNAKKNIQVNKALSLKQINKANIFFIYFFKFFFCSMLANSIAIFNTLESILLYNFV